jgi:uncharacterized protein
MKVVLDTNIFVAAGFNRRSSAAQIIEKVRQGSWRLVWNQATRRETKAVLTQIPPLSWLEFAGLFQAEAEFTAAAEPDHYPFIEDEDDRKFAALAGAAGAVLVSNDDHLLSQRSRLPFAVLTARELIAQQGDGAAQAGASRFRQAQPPDKVIGSKQENSNDGR